MGTFRAAAAQMTAGVTDMLVRLVDGVVQVFTTTRAGGGLLSLELTDTGVGLVLVDQQGIAAGSLLSAPAKLAQVTLNGQERLVWTGGWQAQLGGWGVTGTGELGSSFALTRGPSGVMTAQAFLERDGMAQVILAAKGSDRLEVWQVGERDRMVLVASADLIGFGDQTVDVTALATLRLGGQDYVLSLSTAEEALRIWVFGAGGTLTPVSQVGAGAGLGIATPSALDLVRMAGQAFALVAGAGSSSLSVVRLGADGQMALADHVIDTLDTRFQRLQAIATVELGGQVFIFAGGADDGVQAFQMLPDGRLVLAGQITRGAGLALDNITAIEAVVVEGRIELVVGCEGAGLIRLSYRPGPVAPPQIGGTGGDALTGDTQADMLAGGAGEDTLSGGAGDDILADGAGADALNGGPGADLFVLSGDAAADSIEDFTPGEDRIDLSDWGRVYSISVVQQSGQDDWLVLRWGAETLHVHAAAGQSLRPADFTSSDLFGLWHLTTPVVIAGRRITGTAGADTLTGSGGADTLVGSEGPDLLLGGSGSDVVDYSEMTRGVTANLARSLTSAAGTDGFESVEALSGSAFADRLSGDSLANLLHGRAGDDHLWGHGGNDRLAGGAGNDLLLGGAGKDSLNGGEGTDCASWSSSAVGVCVNLTLALQQGGEAEGDRLESIEGLTGSRYDDRLTGDDGANTLSGGGGGDLLDGGRGNDAVLGGDGADTLDGGKGNSTLNGGAGNDRLVIGRGSDLLIGGAGGDWVVVSEKWALRLDLATAAPQETLGYGLDQVSGIENLCGGQGADTLLGDALANRLIGGAGDDSLCGRGGADLLAGDAGNDMLDGGAGFDWVVFDGAGPLRVDLRMIAAQDTGAGLDRLTAIEALTGGGGADRLHGAAQANRLWGAGGADWLWGEAGDDTLRGGAAADRLHGGAGDDLLLGETGNDRLLFGAGNDRIFGGAGFDTAVFAGTGPLRCDLSMAGPQRIGTGVVTLAGLEGLVGGAKGDALAGNAAANLLNGLAGDDTLRGAEGNDTLLGGTGRDRLFAGEGHNLLNGGFGADRFHFGRGQDRITGFSAAEGDRLVLDDDRLRLVMGLSPAEVVQRFGRDLGDHVRLDFGQAGWVDFAGIGSLAALPAAVEVI